MKRLIITSIVLLAGISGEAMAVDCTNNQVVDTAITTAVSSKTVCASIPGGDKWQEYHQTPAGAANNLIDYKKGPSHAVDPTKPVGTWSTSENGSNSVVTYNYGPGGSYSYKVYLNSGQYTFCGVGSAPTLDVTLLSGQVSCGFP